MTLQLTRILLCRAVYHKTPPNFKWAQSFSEIGLAGFVLSEPAPRVLMIRRGAYTDSIVSGSLVPSPRRNDVNPAILRSADTARFRNYGWRRWWRWLSFHRGRPAVPEARCRAFSAIKASASRIITEARSAFAGHFQAAWAPGRVQSHLARRRRQRAPLNDIGRGGRL